MEVYEETVGLNVRQAHDVFLERLGPSFLTLNLESLVRDGFQNVLIKVQWILNKEQSNFSCC